MGLYRSQFTYEELLELQADGAGKFRGERKRIDVVLYGRSQDGQLAGLRNIGPDENVAIIRLHRMAKVRGQLVDKATGKPLPNQKLHYTMTGAKDDGGRAGFFETYMRDVATTDAVGRFELSNLIVGGKYDLVGPGNQPLRNALIVESSETVDLGEINLNR